MTSPNHKITDALASFSLANLCLISAWFSLLYDADHGYYNHYVVNRSTLLALGVNLTLCSILSWFIIHGARHARKPWLRWGLNLVLFLLLLIPLDFFRRQESFLPIDKITALIRHPAGLLGVGIFSLFCLWQHRRVAQVVVAALVILSPLGFMTLSKAAMVGLGVVRLDQATEMPRLQPMNSVAADQPRVVWIIFDEMEYRTAFEQRPPGVKMPEFDRLDGETLHATHAFPPACYTLLSMPSLITGHRIAKAQVQSHSDLLLTLNGTNSTAPWSSMPSVFGEARTLGYNTALVGWYHPYDRILHRDLNYCVWHSYPPFEPIQSDRFSSALVQQLGSMSGTLAGRWFFTDLCRNSLDESLSVVTNSAYGLSLLHLAPPHKPGVYDPSRHDYSLRRVTLTTGYHNNLMLADGYLGQLRRAMEESGQWNRTWLIISSDHYWRDSQYVYGQKDLRVPFLIKAPAGNRSILHTNQMNTLLTHDLILAILRRDITTQDQAQAWMNAHATADLPIQGEDGKKE